MPGSISSYSAGLAGTALALGSQSSTTTIAKTAAWSGTAVAYGTAIAVAQDTVVSHTTTTTNGFASGGTTSTSHTLNWSVDYSSGGVHVSTDVSLTAASSYGQSDALSGYGVTSPSLQGLF